LSTRTRAILISLIGLVLLAAGIFASVLLVNRFLVKSQESQQDSQIVKGPVVVLTRDMKLGDRLENSDVSIVEVPIDLIPRDAISVPEVAVGKFIKSDMVQGEMLLQHNVADPTNNNHDLSYILSDDHVLMAFPATDLMSVENIPQRGDIIDIFATFSETVKTLVPSEGSTTTVNADGTTTETPLLKVFTVDTFQKVSITALVLNVTTSNTGEENTSLSSYLLALDPQDALVLKHLKDMGANFDIVLRSPTSTTKHELTPVTDDYIVELYGLEVLP
jgi:pilus assembly protein CpaB